MGANTDATRPVVVARPSVDLSTLNTCRAVIERMIMDLLDGTYDEARTRAYGVAFKGMHMVVQMHEKQADRETALLMHEELQATRDERNQNATPGVVRASKAHPHLGAGSGHGDEA